MTAIFTSTFANTLKRTLSAVVADKSDKLESGLVLKKWCNVSSMEDAYEDELEIAGPGLATQKTEGADIQLGTMAEGTLTRYWAFTFALRLVITQEAIEDVKYKEAIDASRKIKRSMYMTADYDSSLMLARAWDTSYLGGDGKPLCSSTHTLPHGGTFSNTMATPMSPSMSSIIVANTQVMDWPGMDGLVSMHKIKKVVFPNAQWAVWANLLKAKFNPVAGNFAEINVVNSEMDIEPVRNPFWLNTTTNYMYITDADDGIKFKWRVKPEGNTWVGHENTVMNHSQRARWARLWTNARGALGVQA